MKINGLVAVCCLSAFLCGCASGISRTGYRLPAGKPSADVAERPIVIQCDAHYDTNDVIVLGSIHAYDTGFSTRCDEPYVLNIFCDEGRILGADLINITEEEQPTIWSTCYRARAQFLRFRNRDEVKGLVSDPKYASDLIAARSAEANYEMKKEIETTTIAGLFAGGGGYNGAVQGAIAGAINGAIGGAIWSASPDVSSDELRATETGQILGGGLGAFIAFQNAEKNSPLEQLRQRALNGDVMSQRLLGLDYDGGHGVRRDYKEAAKWYQLAANRNDPISQNNLGSLYQYGLGNPVNYIKAATLYQQSAAQGFAIAESNLGYMYDNGLGVVADKSAAVKWYRQAAEQDYPGAMLNLGIEYMSGMGVERDLPQAYMWMQSAETVAQLNHDAGIVAVIAPIFDGLKHRMTNDQIVEGTKLFDDWNNSSAKSHQ